MAGRNACHRFAGPARCATSAVISHVRLKNFRKRFVSLCLWLIKDLQKTRLNKVKQGKTRLNKAAIEQRSNQETKKQSVSPLPHLRLSAFICGSEISGRALCLCALVVQFDSTLKNLRKCQQIHKNQGY
jgi:hypothetical protein